METQSQRAARRDERRLRWLQEELPRMRGRIFAALRTKGFTRSAKSLSGSAYYERMTEAGLIQRVRVADHELPMTDQRRHAWDQGSWWTLDLVLNGDADEDQILEDITEL